ncbi:COF family HAD hydrolase protein [Mycoplasmopsis edwardii]|uniref:COF family HAD hydrolase protein n=1 Tax=Mycoplasmopsis edwardii TaxID=53558 RepID=A0A3B0QE44_9BACT|nr:HAD hydrolase family protein [Mycoplasmopsis edwardii]SYV97953.1 COF family HAD hydrolase protein [Mycoplasmopsis edwardii]
MQKKVSNELAHELRNHDCEVYLTNSVYTDVNGKNSSKFNALKVLAKELDIDIKNTVAFGDSGNDVQMLKGAGIGVAMGNATPEAKEVAVITIGHHNTGAIGEYLIELLNKMS